MRDDDLAHAISGAWPARALPEGVHIRGVHIDEVGGEVRVAVEGPGGLFHAKVGLKERFFSGAAISDAVNEAIRQASEPPPFFVEDPKP